MFHRDKKHYVTAEIRKIPVAYLSASSIVQRLLRLNDC